MQTLPEQYTARNIAVLVQTVVRGLTYLITFIFGANALGLSGEAVGCARGAGIMQACGCGGPAGRAARGAPPATAKAARLLRAPPAGHLRSGLTLQMLLYPDSLKEERRTVSKEERLPSVNVADDIGALRRAFAEAERQGIRDAQRKLASKDE